MTTTRTTQGAVEGTIERGCHIFRGVPFAAPPVGDLRYRAPQMAESWSGTRLCDTFGPGALQTQHRLPGFSAEEPLEEDCLYLNVYTPGVDATRRPVFVWIHGGAFTHGSGKDPLYDGVNLALRGDIVVVTINYRLGAMGFLHLKERLGEHGLANNLGLLDCVAALEWVRANIANFGGDPSNVTIGGESAGAMASGCLLAMPAARGLFHRAILQSGQGRGNTAEDAARLVDDVLAELDFAPEEAPALLSIPAERIPPALERALKGALRAMPRLDPDTLPEQPLAAIAAGATEGIDIMLGHNRDEHKLFMIGPGRREEISEETLLRRIGAVLPTHDEGALRTIAETYRTSRKTRDLPASNMDISDAILGDVLFRVGGVALAEAHTARGGKAFMYIFDQESPARGGSLGACHALEIPFVFGNTGLPSQLKFAGEGPGVERLSADMMDAWCAFFRSGNPAHEGIGPWSPYNVQSRPTMIFGPNTGQQEAPFDEERAILAAR